MNYQLISLLISIINMALEEFAVMHSFMIDYRFGSTLFRPRQWPIGPHLKHNCHWQLRFSNQEWMASFLCWREPCF